MRNWNKNHMTRAFARARPDGDLGDRGVTRTDELVACEIFKNVVTNGPYLRAHATMKLWRPSEFTDHVRQP